MRKSYRASRFLALAALALALSMAAPAARAQGEIDPVSSVEGVNWQRVGSYVGCALGIASASTGFALTGAIYLCLTLMFDP